MSDIMALPVAQTVWQVVQVLLVTIGFFAFYWILSKVIGWLERRTLHFAGLAAADDHAVMQAIREETRILDAKFFGLAFNMVKITFALILLAFYLPVAFTIFPETEDLGSDILVAIFEPLADAGQAFLNYLPNFVEIVITIVITYYLLRIGRFIARKTAEGTFTFDGFYPDWAMPTYNIVKVIVIVLAFAIIYPLLPGYNQEEFQYISLAFGFLASLGAASVTANIAAGIVITYMRPFQVGDHVAIDDIEGDVVERTLLVTRLNTLRNEDVTVPNAKVLGDSITNFTRNANEHGIVVSARISIGYDVPWHKVRELLLDAASRSDGIDATPSPFVRQVSLEDFYIVYDVCGTTRTPQNRGAILSELHAHILDVFNAAGVEILSPHFEAGRDGKASTVIVPRSPMESDTT